MADVILNITIPDAYITRALNAFATIVDTHMTIEARGFASEPQDEFNGRWDFIIAPKGVGETNKEFGERVLRELGKAVINMVDKAEDETRYRNEVATVAPPESDVPNDILT